MEEGRASLCINSFEDESRADLIALTGDGKRSLPGRLQQRL
jgi:hypothetical protein